LIAIKTPDPVIPTTTLCYKGNRGQDIETWQDDWHLEEIGSTTETSSGNAWFDFDVRRDRNSHIAGGETVIAILIGAGWEKEFANDCAVLFVPSKRKGGKYERIGIMEVSKDDFKSAEEMVLDII
jgi:hypothetical protein